MTIVGKPLEIKTPAAAIERRKKMREDFWSVLRLIESPPKLCPEGLKYWEDIGRPPLPANATWDDVARIVSADFASDSEKPGF